MKQAIKLLDILVLCVVLALMLCACIGGTQGASVASTQPTPSVADKTELAASQKDEPTASIESEPIASPEGEPTASIESEPTASPEGEPTASIESEPTASPEGEPIASIESEPTASSEGEPNKVQNGIVLTEDNPPYQHMYEFKPSPSTAPTISHSENSEQEDIVGGAFENQRINIILLLAVAAVIEMLIILFMAALLFKSRRKKPEDEDRVNKEDTDSAPIQNDQLSREDVITMIEAAMQKQKPVPLTKLYKEDEAFMALITLGDEDKLRLELEKDGDEFVLKRKAPEKVTQNVMMEVEGIYTDKLSPTDKKTRLVVTYEPDSIWAYLDLDYETLTEAGVKGDKLERFFGFTSIPPAPSAFEIKVVKKAKLTRKGQDFFLVEKGEVEVNK